MIEQEDIIRKITSKCIVDENSCWNWTNTSGYGKLVWNGKWYSTHRLMYILIKGSLDLTDVVRHLCHNKRCCNPDHLQAGSRRENTLDSVGYAKQTSSNSIHHKKGLKGVEVIDWLDTITNKSSGCWEYPVVGQCGYPKIQLGNKCYLLHRYVCSVIKNLDYQSKDWVARHICHNKCCVNPKHIIPGTTRDNGIDSREYNKKTKLNIQLVMKIKQDWSLLEMTRMEFYHKWANRINVSPDAIRNVVSGRRWSDIHP